MTRRGTAAVSASVLMLAGAGVLATCNRRSSPSAGTPPDTLPSAPPPASSKPACDLPPGTGNGQNCPRETSNFLPKVERSLDRLIEEHPGIFDLQSTQGCGTCYRIRDTDAYIKGMLKQVRSEGVCATWDGEELAIKNSNDFSDQYDIITFENFIRRDHGSYRATCRPAWF